MFNTILIANRGEIAERVIRSAKNLGYNTVAIYSPADSNSPHVLSADQAINLHANSASESYLDIAKVIAAAKQSGADAIHPGYGFLSENPQFAKACAQAGINFIGPSAESMVIMGDKQQAKACVEKFGVPCIPGFNQAKASDEQLINAAKDIGYPLMVKAVAGGGGRGIRLVESRTELAAAINEARLEAKNSFANDDLILEKAVINARHIEVQIFADKAGHVVHLGERDCSVQRRHQKVVEEAPSPFVDPQLRQALGQAAIQAAKACDYVGAGTVEFLVDGDKQFYFLEMNTRLQVEHPVTECISGQDLVEWQINVAQGLALPLNQEQIALNGHAIEVRLYAEDPAQEFTPQVGEILHFASGNNDVRIDSGISADTATKHQAVSSFYDPMLAKFIAYGATREKARLKLIRALKQSSLLGLKDNRRFLCEILEHEDFIAGDATTEFLNQVELSSSSSHAIDAQELALANLLFSIDPNQAEPKRDPGGWHSASGIKNANNSQQRSLKLAIDDEQIQLDSYWQGRVLHLQNGDENIQIEFVELEQLSQQLKRLSYVYRGVQQTCLCYFSSPNEVHIDRAGYNRVCQNLSLLPAGGLASSGKQITASMDGMLAEVLVKVGDKVEQGQTLATLEAMKMLHQLKAKESGVIAEIKAEAGQQLKKKQLIISLED